MLAAVIDIHHRLDDTQGAAGLLRGAHQRHRVLGKAGAAIARPRMQEFAPDAPVKADTLGHVMNVGAQLLAQIGNLVDEGDLGGEEGIGRVFDHLAGFQRGHNDGRLDEEQRPVEIAHNLLRPRALGADDHAVRPHEIADGGPFAQKFRVGGNVEIGIRPCLPDNPLHLAPGADRHGGFGDHHRVTVQRLGDFLRGGIDIAEVSMAIAAPAGRADRDEHGVRALDPFGQVGGEGQAPGLDVRRDQLGQPRLIDRHDILVQQLDLARVLVDAHHVMSEIGEARPGNQADIARADHRNTHAGSPFRRGSPPPYAQPERAMRPKNGVAMAGRKGAHMA